MSAPEFFTEVTDAGQAKLAAALGNNQPLVITQIAAGSGLNDAAYVPDKTQTALKGEQWRAAVNSVGIDPANPKWIKVTGEIPTAVGGFTVREVGIFTADGTLVAISRVPDSYKPLPTSGAAFPLPVEVVFQVTNTAAVTLVVSASSYATEVFVTNNMSVHEAKPDPHPQYATAEELEAAFAAASRPARRLFFAMMRK